MDYNKITKNVDILCGLNGLKHILECTWCVNGQRITVLKYIANKYGIVELNPEDNKLLPGLIDSIESHESDENSDIRYKLAKKYGISVTKVRPIGNGKYLIRGRVYEE